MVLNDGHMDVVLNIFLDFHSALSSNFHSHMKTLPNEEHLRAAGELDLRARTGDTMVLCCAFHYSHVQESSSTTPLLFVLSPGTDPTAALLSFANAMKFGNKISVISMGQGQSKISVNSMGQGQPHWMRHNEVQAVKVWVSKLGHPPLLQAAVSLSSIFAEAHSARQTLKGPKAAALISTARLGSW
eukprot:scaffold5468_cov22-Tisochrysis_lutea.AAC.1